jgi:thymidylate synthase
LLKTVVNEGKLRPNRTDIDAISIFGHSIKFNITNTIPLLTTKFVPVRLIIEELLFFLRGDTDSKILNAANIKIWNANTTREFLDSRGLTDYDVGVMGPMYGYNWRHFGALYDPTCATPAAGFDQLNALIDGLINDPYSRRHLLTTYDPSTVSKCVLAPCHGIVTQFYVDDGFLHCTTYCRSSDTFLGLPFNIASYAILTQIIAKKCGYLAGELTILTGDTHLYINHIAQYETQVARKPLPFPKLKISDDVIEKKWEDIANTDFELIAYIHGPAISAEVAA